MDDNKKPHTHNGRDSLRVNLKDIRRNIQDHIADPSGGTIVDIQARAAIVDIIDALEALGFLKQ